MSGSSRPSADDAGGGGPIRLARILDLPELTGARPAPTPVGLDALIELCEAHLSLANGRPGAEQARLTGKSRVRFTL